jgi:hypothetical protein
VLPSNLIRLEKLMSQASDNKNHGKKRLAVAALGRSMPCVPPPLGSRALLRLRLVVGHVQRNGIAGGKGLLQRVVKQTLDPRRSFLDALLTRQE